MLDKKLNNHNISQQIEMLRMAQKTIVFTNGCFDILHPGHIDYLSKAKKLGDILIIGLNDDQSVRTLKGNSRPINPLKDRTAMLTALQSVDFVISFAEETPIRLIEKIKPDFLVKGGDYTKENIVGASFVEENGGQVEIIPFLEGYSSSRIIERIKSL
mgnify:CR=1 FL=1